MGTQVSGMRARVKSFKKVRRFYTFTNSVVFGEYNANGE